MGHYYGGMLDIYSDLTLQCATFGGHMEIVEVDELAASAPRSSGATKSRSASRSSNKFRRAAGLLAIRAERAARTSVALDRLVERHDLGSLAYY